MLENGWSREREATSDGQPRSVGMLDEMLGMDRAFLSLSRPRSSLSFAFFLFLYIYLSLSFPVWDGYAGDKEY